MPSSLHLHPPLAAAIGSSCRHKQTQPTTLTRFFPLPSWMSLPDTVATYHIRTVGPNQCCSAVVQTIKGPIESVWSIVRRFDNPQAYKQFLRSCQVIVGDGDVGSLREVHVVSGLPAASSMEKLEILDDERYVLSFSVVGGDHRLTNYRSVTTLHGTPEGNGTVVVESYVVDIPVGNSREDTCIFVDTIVRCNLQSLARMSENMARTETLSSP
ncbi:Abscisic acid receptor PYL6 [Hibiscus syriacus]|uniref:Abscisic acid receptor PYL6 n=1 Tax=Hibiscus syriacus TaxID=106335 RepID=A0A6A2XIU3_HIBSY|nr:abscisic acid receptor PYL4-like [Hibiscus syriacus]KAE8653704.1 Abscisic acid receptor PYL6 [Hibiscus syriacus]